MIKIRTKHFASLLLLIFFTICTTSILNKYLTVDESLYIVSGYSYLKTFDFRLNPEHPIFTKILYGVPLLLLNPKLPLGSKNWKALADKIDVGANYGFAADFYKENLIMLRAIVFSARIVAILLAVLLGIIIFFWSKEAFGSKAALLALFLYCFEPNIVAHARLATLDMPLTLFVFASFYFAWKFVRSARAYFLILSSLCISFALLTKYTALLFFPLLFLFILLHYKELNKNRIKFFKEQRLLYYAFIFSVLIIVPIVLANALYALESYKPNHYFFIPARIAEGFNFISSWVEQGREGYLFGEFRVYIPEYFLVAFIIKTTLAFLLILATSFYLFIKRPRLELFSVLMPALLFFIIFSLFIKFYLGLRYILPAFPFLFVFVSGALANKLKNITKNLLVSVLFFSLLAWHALASLAIYPHYLEYFNELIGGPANGPKYLTDSNIDWGQDLFYFIEFAKEKNWQNPHFIYFGWPYATMLIKSHYEPVCKPSKIKLAISVTALTGISKDSNCWHWLFNYEPKARIGWSIYYYEIN